MLLQVIVLGALATHAFGVAESLVDNTIDVQGSNPKMDPFLKLLQGVKKFPVGKLPEGQPAKLLVADGNTCHIDVMVPQKVPGKCMTHSGNPMCVSNDKMEINYKDCLLIEAKDPDWRGSAAF